MAYVHLAHANYENVQNTKFVRKFVHIFARPVAKLRSNFRCAEPLYLLYYSVVDLLVPVVVLAPGLQRLLKVQDKLSKRPLHMT